VRDLGRIVSVYVASERTGLGWHFRVLVLGLTLAAIVFVNISVIVLLRIVSMILRPVDQLGAASQALADGRFGQRVELDRDDEFGELAHVFNRMAAQLEANEERKMDTLRQVAVTLNHGLNNAINAIDLQLKLVDRDAGPNAMLKERLERIHQSLAGMTRAVQALTKVRRIVLTEYMPGQLMLDLGRSIEADPLDEPASTPAAATPAGRST
jgi:nitrogen fixation/metabolism regulation signal transduction histidine kinase